MSLQRHSSTIPAWLVRTVASVILALSTALAIIAIVNFSTFGWLLASSIIVGSGGSMYFEIMALITGDPEYILLDLILQ